MRKSSEGQAFVVVLLSMAAVLTMALYVVSNSITDIAVSTRQEESVRAFSAAEAGIEQVLVGGTTGTNIDIGTAGAKYTSAVSNIGEGSAFYKHPTNLVSGGSGTIWFVSHDAGTGVMTCAGYPCSIGTAIRVCWGFPGTSNSSVTTPAIEASVNYLTDLTLPDPTVSGKIARNVYDPNTGRITANSFDQVDAGTCIVDGQSYEFQKNISFGTGGFNIQPTSVFNNPGHLRFMRVRMLYNDIPQPMAVVLTGGTLPSQGQVITSIGYAGESQRKVEVFQGWPEFPDIFNYAVFSTSEVVHN